MLPVPNAVSATNGERHCQIHYCTCEWGVVNGLWRSSMLFPAANFYSCNYKPFVHHRHHCQIPPPTTTLLSAILLSATLLRAISSKLPLIRNNFNFHNPSVFVLVLDSASSIFFSIVLPTPTQLSGGTASGIGAAARPSACFAMERNNTASCDTFDILYAHLGQILQKKTVEMVGEVCRA